MDLSEARPIGSRPSQRESEHCHRKKEESQTSHEESPCSPDRLTEEALPRKSHKFVGYCQPSSKVQQRMLNH